MPDWMPMWRALAERERCTGALARTRSKIRQWVVRTAASPSADHTNLFDD